MNRLHMNNHEIMRPIYKNELEHQSSSCFYDYLFDPVLWPWDCILTYLFLVYLKARAVKTTRIWTADAKHNRESISLNYLLKMFASIYIFNIFRISRFFSSKILAKSEEHKLLFKVNPEVLQTNTKKTPHIYKFSVNSFFKTCYCFARSSFY